MHASIRLRSRQLGPSTSRLTIENPAYAFCSLGTWTPANPKKQASEITQATRRWPRQLRTDAANAIDGRRERPSAGLSASVLSSAGVTINQIHIEPSAPKPRASELISSESNGRVRHCQEWIFLSRLLAAFASLNVTGVGARIRRLQRMALMAEMCDHQRMVKKERRRPLTLGENMATLSTGGTRRAGRQPRCGPCPMKPAPRRLHRRL